MAEYSPKQGGLKKLQGEITCPLCLGEFDSPKRLPCGHIYCKVPCLQGLLLQSRRNATVTCPECRRVARIPANDLDKLPNVFQINRLKGVYSELSEDIATHASQQGISHPCPNHPSQPQDLYCETCQELICRDCILVAHQHQEHKYSFVKDVAAEQKEAVLKELVPVETLTRQATDSLATIEEVKRDVINEEEDLAKEITASFNALFHVLEEQKQSLLVKLREQTDPKLAKVETQQQKVEAANEKLQQVAKSVHAAVAYDDDGHEFLSKKPQLVDKITEATNTYPQVSLTPTVELDLVANVLSPAELEQACAQTNYVRKRIIPDPQRCSAKGDGLKSAEINSSYLFTVHVANEQGIPCSGEVSIELKTLRFDIITRPRVTACSPSLYKVSYTATARGRHELSVKVNGKHITGSPFKVFVRMPVSKIKYPVDEITEVVSPVGLHSAAGSILVCDYKGDQIVIYDRRFRKVTTVGGSGLHGPTDVTTDSRLNIYVITGQALHKFTKDGNHVRTVTGSGRKGGLFNSLSGLCIFEDRLLYVCESKNHRVLVFDLNLKYLSKKISGGLKWPSGLDVDTSGKIYICDSLSHI